MNCKKLKFKEAFKKLEEISLEMESADLDLEKGMKLVKEAEELHGALKGKLSAAKLKIKE
ncbi:MAG: hypothetical protein ACD_63C00217G0002 [uncultured bacterium]|nr:MAG: hypothetical protein ACD_63C00217G0002 [uncultured bacterium]